MVERRAAWRYRGHALVTEILPQLGRLELLDGVAGLPQILAIRGRPRLVRGPFQRRRPAQEQIRQLEVERPHGRPEGRRPAPRAA